VEAKSYVETDCEGTLSTGHGIVKERGKGRLKNPPPKDQAVKATVRIPSAAWEEFLKTGKRGYSLSD